MAGLVIALVLLSFCCSAKAPPLANISSVHAGYREYYYWKQDEWLYYLFSLTLSALSPTTVHAEWEFNAIVNFSRIIAHGQNLSQCWICHPHPQSDTSGLKVLHFTPQNDHLALTLADRSAKPTPPEVHIPSLRQLPSLDLAPYIHISNEYKSIQSEVPSWASLVAQWLRICLPMQGTRVRALVREDATCRGATGPVSHNY